MVAKNIYVDTRSGWFSDRSACYLASGRPVLAQDTGLDGLVPARRGAADLLHARRGGGGGRGDRRATTSGTAARRGRSPRSTSPPSGCCRGCSRSSECDEHRRRRRSPRQQAGQRRRGMGEAELGPRPASGSASTSGSSSSSPSRFRDDLPRRRHGSGRSPSGSGSPAGRRCWHGERGDRRPAARGPAGGCRRGDAGQHQRAPDLPAAVRGLPPAGDGRHRPRLHPVLARRGARGRQRRRATTSTSRSAS